MSTPSRRDVVKATAGGALVLGVGGTLIRGLEGRTQAVAAVPGVLDVYVNEGFVPMVDGSLVYMRGFGDRATERDDADPSLTFQPHVFVSDGSLIPSRSYPLDAELPESGSPAPARKDPEHPGHYLVRRAHWASYFPRRTIIAETGATVRLRVHNRLAGTHELAVPDLGVSTGPIPPGGAADLVLQAGVAGTYLYADPTNAPVERVLGLHGVLVVVPADDRWRLSPGGVEFERQWVWLCQDVEPVWSRLAQDGVTIDRRAVPAVPRYFMLNDRSGFRALAATRDEEANRAAHEDTLISGAPRRTDMRDFSGRAGADGTVVTGQLVRMVNAGLVVHQMHFHGNHVWTVRVDGTDLPRAAGRISPEGHVLLQAFEDVVELDPVEAKEIVLPLRRPPESIDQVWNARRTDWHYPMHCHAEPSQTAAGGLYPGGLVADWTLTYPEPDRREVPHELFASQTAFASNQPRAGSPVTEFLQRPDRVFERQFFNRRFRFPDGSEHEIWTFQDPKGRRNFPAPVIRVTEGELVHVKLKPSKGPHTIHLHGMEPDPRNDGVGHTSFEVTGSYTYQWRPEIGEPGDVFGTGGTYFYHCHVNTVLHVQMGMFGPLIVDPVVHPDFPVPPGARRSFVDGPLYDIDSEILLAPYSIDPRWHRLNHAAGLSGEDVGLNRFDPQHFFVLGGSVTDGPPDDAVWASSEVRAKVAGTGHPTLLRLLNSNYFPTRLRITTLAGAPAHIAEVIAHDGRGIRDTSDRTGASPPISDAGLFTDRLAFGSAERYDVLLHPPVAGTYLLHVDWSDWRLDEEAPPVATRTVRLLAR